MSEYTANVTAVMKKAIDDPEAFDEIREVPKLMVDLMSANFRDYSNTVTLHTDMLQETIDDLRAELAAIRVRINHLFAGDYMPSESAIQLAVFHPSRELMAELRKRES